MSRAESKAVTRQSLLASGRAAFAAKGLSGATVEEIAAGAGFTRGAFYANFDDKADLLWELVEADNEASFASLESRLAEADLGQKMAVLQEWYDGRLGSDPLGRARVELFLQAGDTPAGRARIAAFFASERRAIVELVKGVQEVTGTVLPVPLEHFAAMGFALGAGLADQHLVDPARVPRSLFADAQAYLWLGVLAAAESTEFTPTTGVAEPR